MIQEHKTLIKLCNGVFTDFTDFTDFTFLEQFSRETRPFRPIISAAWAIVTLGMRMTTHVL